MMNVDSRNTISRNFL